MVYGCDSTFSHDNDNDSQLAWIDITSLGAARFGIYQFDFLFVLFLSLVFFLGDRNGNCARGTLTRTGY